MRPAFSATLGLCLLLTVSFLPPAWSVPVEPAERAAKEEQLPPPPANEVLAKITAPPAAPAIKTKSGYTVTLDLSKQVLNVSSPKKEIWLAREIEPQQTVEVTREGTSLQQDRNVLARLKKGRILFVTEVKGEWAATSVVAGGKVLRGWVKKADLKPFGEEGPPQKTLAGMSDGQFASAAVLIQKAKQFDDGLYAAVELAMQDGLGPVTGKRAWLARLAAKVNAEQGGVPLAQLYAASELGGGDAAIPGSLKRGMASERAAFLADEKRSKPLGFYTWNKDLASIFQQDRILQTALPAGEHAAGIATVAAALASDAEARKSYELVLHLNERLTNPLKTAGYRGLLTPAAEGKPLGLPPSQGVSFFPPSRGPETDLVMRLYADKPIPEGFDLMKEVIARVKSGDLSLRPREDSGWYDYQLWALDPLIRLDAAPEGSRLHPNDEYKKHLEELFKGTFALTRETHVKQLEFPEPKSEAPDGTKKKEREKVFIAPNPHVEILPAMYLRRAQSYAYVRGVLEETFGQANLAAMHRLTAAGPVKQNLDEELASMERLFLGAHVVACRDLGLAEDPAAAAAGSADEQAVHFLRWVASVASDPDLARDSRMMVPVFFDLQRQKTKVWVMLGWTSTAATYGYDQLPKATITGPDGKPAAGEDAPEPIFHGTWRQLATPVFAEVYVTKLLNRDEFRRHCDTYATQAAILSNLE
jgi:hypothetical protein